MSIRSMDLLQRYLRRLCDEAAPSEDAVLLERFVGGNDRSAFELLMARHGGMVLGTARRLTDNEHDAEDVFQAVFLSLARLAKSIRRGRALPAWLHRTTCRIAARLRASRCVPRLVRAPSLEPSQPSDPAAALAWREVCQALDEELEHLPERLRAPLLLCYLSGLTRAEAARQLGWSFGTLKRRLEQGRHVLRVRLERRGITAVGLALAVLAPATLQAAVSKSLLDSTISVVFSTKTAVPAALAALTLGSAGTLRGVIMKWTLALVAVIGLGIGIYAATGQGGPTDDDDTGQSPAAPAQAQAVTQQDEDALPAGSVLRFGTSRYRLGIPVSTLAVSADGKLAVAVNGDHIPWATRAFDLESGRALYTISGSGDMPIEAAAIAPDRRTIVTRQHTALRIRDAVTGRELRKLELPLFKEHSRNEWIAVTPDGKAVAATSHGDVIHLINIANGKIIREFSNADPKSAPGLGWATVLGIAFSKDGKLMATGGSNRVGEMPNAPNNAPAPGTYFARLWDVQTGKELRRFMHGMGTFGVQSLAFSPDAKLLATRSHDGRLRLFDVDTGKERKSFPYDGDGHRPGAVAFSPDGKTVAAAGESIRLYDLATLEERLRIDRRQAIGLAFTDGGKTLVGAVMGTIYRWDATTGKALIPESGDSAVEQILVTRDGSRVVTCGRDGDAHIWDGASGRHLRALHIATQHGLAMSPDGRFLAYDVPDPSITFTDPEVPNMRFDGNRLQLYDIAAARFVDRFPGFKGAAHDLTFTDGGRTLVAVDHRDGMVRIWDVQGGNKERNFRAVPPNQHKQILCVWRTALSPDGKTLATYNPVIDAGSGQGGSMRVLLWDVATGRALHTLDGDLRAVVGMAFSPDGRLLATAGETGPALVWETATGKRVGALPAGLPIVASAVAFLGDGRYLATAEPQGAIRLWEVASWTQLTEFKGHRDRPTALTFAPTGRLLSGSRDTTVLAWDIRPPKVAASVSLDRAWNDLAAKEARESFKSEGRFLAAPAETVKLFAAKIEPAVPVDPKQVARLLADLGSDDFVVRDAATRALEQLDRQVTPYLEKALSNAGTVEARRRLEQMIDKRRTGLLTPEQLRHTRAVMILERIGDGAAQALLRRWASGPSAAQLTMEAAAALRHLDIRPRTTSNVNGKR
jgi:RNA polymerase sigma factor (sigma-70 family)